MAAETVTEQEVQEALDMLGAGYDQPTVTVEPPKRTMQRRGRQMVEVEEPAFVKFSTEFKAELADLDAFALKVFIYIGLSIGYETGTAWPGVRKIAKETGMNKDTVTKAIEELENKGFLKVNRRDGGSNVYKPTCYFAIGEGVPCGRTVDELSDETVQLSGGGAKLSDENAKLSDACRVNRTQQDKQESTRKPDLLDGILAYQKTAEQDKPAIDDFERSLGFGALPWYSNTSWEKFRRFVVRVSAAAPGVWKDYAAWRNSDGKYKAFSNRKIRENPAAFMDTGYPEYEASKMYRKDVTPANTANQSWRQEVNLG